MILLLYTKLMILWCDFNVFAGWIDNKYIYNLDTKIFYIDGITDGLNT
jgi:hypothetical protein